MLVDVASEKRAKIKRKEHKRRLHPAVQPGSRRELDLDNAQAAVGTLTTELVKKDSQKDHRRGLQRHDEKIRSLA